jgi:very-short-patch-repair endonuclease
MAQRRLTAEAFRALAKPGAWKKRKKPQDAADYFVRAWQLRPLAGVEMETEYRFHPARRWRFDIAFPALKLAVEIDGRGTGGHMGGHHSVVSARRDAEKRNEAVRLGWRILAWPATDKGQCNRWVEFTKLVIGALL